MAEKNYNPRTTRGGDKIKEERAARALLGILAGAGDFGGAGSAAANALGYPEVESWLLQNKAAAPDAASLGQFINPLSILGPIKDVASGIRDSVMGEDGPEPPKLIPREEFFASRRSKRGSLKDAQDAAEERVRNSKAYADAIERGQRTTAQRMIDQSRKNAETGWKEDQKTIADEDQRLEADYKAVKAQYDRDLESYYGQDFRDRNPGLAKAFAAGGPLLAALLTGGVGAMTYRGVKKASGAVDAARAAARSGKGSVSDVARAEEVLKAKQAAAPAKIATAGAFSVPIPFELQAAGDIFDYKSLSPTYQDSEGNWQPALAQQAAAEKLSDPVGYVGDNALSFLTGGLGAALGYKAASLGNPSAEVAAQLSTRSKSELDQIVNRFRDEATANRDLEDELIRLSQRPRPAPAPQGGPPQAAPQPAANAAAAPAPVLAPNPAPIGGNPGNPGAPPAGVGPVGGPVGGGQNVQRQPSQYASYRGTARQKAQDVWNEQLDAIPLDAQPSYTPNIDDLLNNIIAVQGPRGVNPADLRTRAQGSIDQFNTIRASGGDPFSPAARASMLGGREKLALAILMAGGAESAMGPTLDINALLNEGLSGGY